jgi:ABC-2 type transport system ATP-binding protein
MVLELRAVHDATIVLTTHDRDEADRMCDRLAVIDRGRIIALDSPSHLKQGGSMEDVFMQLTSEEPEDEAA